MDYDSSSILKEAFKEAFLVEAERDKKHKEIEERLISKLSHVPIGQKFNVDGYSYEVVDLAIMPIVERISWDKEVELFSLVDMLRFYLDWGVDDAFEVEQADLDLFLDNIPSLSLCCICTSSDDPILKELNDPRQKDVKKTFRRPFPEKNVFNYLNGRI
jgi:hypothetical protein